MNALDLIVVAPELVAFEDVIEHIEKIGGHAEVRLDSRRSERRRATSDTSENRRRADRRTNDVGESLRSTGWAHVPADERG